MKKRWTVMAGILISLIGCAPRMSQPSSVLGADIPFHVDPSDKDVLIYSNPSIKVTSYSKFLIDPVKIVTNERHTIKPEQEKMLAEKFRTDLIDVLKSGYPIVDEAGPGVLRVRTAIQDIQPAHVQLDEDKMLVLRMDTLVTHVAIELDCVDSLSGDRVVALIHTLKDRRYFEKEKTTRYLNIQEAFRVWTKDLRRRFDAAKERSNSGFEGLDRGEDSHRRFEEGE